jgi:hypothetical protein
MWRHAVDMYYWQIKHNDKIVGETQPFTIHQMDDRWVKEERNYIMDKNTENNHKPTIELKKL